MAQTIRIEYFGMEGSGPTVKEARADAGQKIEKALRGSYEPQVIAFDGQMAILWREPKHGWLYGRIVDGALHPGGMGAEESCDEAKARARFDLAQLAWSPDSDDEEILAFVIDRPTRCNSGTGSSGNDSTRPTGRQARVTLRPTRRPR